MKKILIGLSAVIVLGTWTSSAQSVTYDIDLAHSTVEFKIHHLLSNVRGNFDQVSGTFDYDPGSEY